MLPRKYFDNLLDSFLDDGMESMKCDIYEKGGAYHIEADMPGIDRKDIKIEYNNGNITIKATKSKKEEDKDKDYIRSERSFGEYERTFYVGDIDENKISAKLNNGVLKVSIPKIDENKNKKVIEIK